MLLLVPSMAGLVGGVVLPLLGAVPDGGTWTKRHSRLGIKNTITDTKPILEERNTDWYLLWGGLQAFTTQKKSDTGFHSFRSHLTFSLSIYLIG